MCIGIIRSTTGLAEATTAASPRKQRRASQVWVRLAGHCAVGPVTAVKREQHSQDAMLAGSLTLPELPEPGERLAHLEIDVRPRLNHEGLGSDRVTLDRATWEATARFPPACILEGTGVGARAERE